MTSEREKLLLEELEQSELTMGEELPAGTGVRRGRTSVYSLRLPPDAVEALESLARQRDVPASAIARGFVLAGLADAGEPENVQVIIKHVEADIRKLKRLVGQMKVD